MARPEGPSDRATPADIEVLDRVIALRRLAEAVAIGVLMADPLILDGLGRLVAKAAMWARVADAERGGDT